MRGNVGTYGNPCRTLAATAVIAGLHDVEGRSHSGSRADVCFKMRWMSEERLICGAQQSFIRCAENDWNGP